MQADEPHKTMHIRNK